MARRLSVLVLLIGLAGCGASPRALGLTGAQPKVPPSPAGDSTLSVPGLPQPGGAAATGLSPDGTGTGVRYYGSP
ncbi:MAG: hypothetical protein KGL52_02750 [Rhodospirillales bacterium]|jgi:hypothetical protein|nr:hypothetical protein [Rhodospirillales bacterium]